VHAWLGGIGPDATELHFSNAATTILATRLSLNLPRSGPRGVVEERREAAT
jgi:hypothetical protein